MPGAILNLLKSWCDSSHENTDDRYCSLACTSSTELYSELFVTSPLRRDSMKCVMLLKNKSIMFSSLLAHAVTQCGPCPLPTNCWNELNSLGSSWIDITIDLNKQPNNHFQKALTAADVFATIFRVRTTHLSPKDKWRDLCENIKSFLGPNCTFCVKKCLSSSGCFEVK